MTTGILLNLKIQNFNTPIYIAKSCQTDFIKQNICFKYPYDKFSVEPCSDANYNRTIQFIRAQVQ